MEFYAQSMESIGPRRQFAKVKDLAIDPFSDTSHKSNDVSSEILSRIKKCLDRANHPTTPEAEAQAALRVAHKLMQQYNVQQVDVYADAIDADQVSKIAGQSTVSILSNKTKVQLETWTLNLASAIEDFFDCKFYSTERSSSIEFTFYGIALNTAAAAMSFEMVVNLTQEWAFQRKKGNKNSYRLGVANGLRRMAQEEKELEQQRAEEQEAAELAARVREEQLQREFEIRRLKQAEAMEQEQPILDPDECVAKVLSDPKLVFICAMLVLHKDTHDEFGVCDGKEGDSGLKIYERVTVKDEETDELYENTDQKSANLKTRPGHTRAHNAIDSTNLDIDPEYGTRDRPFMIFKEEDDDYEMLDITVNLDDTIRHHMPVSTTSISQSDPNDTDTGATPLHGPSTEDDMETIDDHEEDVTWRSATALIKYRDDAEKIADDYLKAQDVELTSGPRRDWKIQDQKSYDDGKADSKKIDVKRRRIEDGEVECDTRNDCVKRRRIQDGTDR